jgi:hypothetical protein
MSNFRKYYAQTHNLPLNVYNNGNEAVTVVLDRVINTMADYIDDKLDEKNES